LLEKILTKSIHTELNKQQLNTQKHEVVWKPYYNLTNGHYFIALKINDLQVDYMKVIRQK